MFSYDDDNNDIIKLFLKYLGKILLFKLLKYIIYNSNLFGYVDTYSQ